MEKIELFEKYFKEFKDESTSYIKTLNSELLKNSADRVNVSFIENLKVKTVEGIMILKSIGMIRVINNRCFSVKVFIPSYKKNIKNTIVASNLEVVNIEEVGNNLIVNLPMVTDELKKRLILNCKKILENFKVRLRNLKHKIWNRVKEHEKGVSKDYFQQYKKDLDSHLHKIEKSFLKEFKEIEKKLLK